MIYTGVIIPGWVMNLWFTSPLARKETCVHLPADDLVNYAFKSVYIIFDKEYDYKLPQTSSVFIKALKDLLMFFNIIYS